MGERIGKWEGDVYMDMDMDIDAGGYMVSRATD